MKIDSYSDEEIENNLERFEKKSGYKCNLKNPQTYLEKLMYKKIYDRNPVLTLTSDKLLVRKYVVDKIGKSFEKHLAKIIYILDKDYKYNFLPAHENKYILKSNNASGRIRIMEANTPIKKRKKIYEKVRGWFTKPYGAEKLEWVYKHITPRIFGEEFILDNNKLPLVYRFVTFSGIVKYIEIYEYREEKGKKFFIDAITTYNRNFEKLNIKWNAHLIGKIELSNFTKELIELSEKICVNTFDHCRVDFLVCKNNFYLSELTHLPISGMGTIVPHEYDIEMGNKWKEQKY